MSSRPLPLVGLLLIVPLFSPGCTRKPAAPVNKPSPVGQTFIRTITDEEIASFASAFQAETSVAEPDPDRINALFNWNAVVDPTFATLNFADGDRPAYRERIARASRNAFREVIVEALKRGAVFEFLRAIHRRDEHWALFRCRNSKDRSLRYLGLLLGRDADRRIRIHDVDDYITAERWSKILDQVLPALLAEEQQSAISRILTKSNVYAKYPETVKSFNEMNRRGDAQQILDAYNKLPDELKKERSIQLTRIRAASGISEARYREALGEYWRIYPDVGSLDLFLIEYDLFYKQYADALTHIDRLDRRVGGDPYLDYWRAITYLESNDLPRSEAAIDRAIAAIPSDIKLFWTSVEITVRARNYPKTLSRVKEIVTRFHLEPGDFTTDPYYADFVKSPEHAELLKFLADHPPTPSPADKP